MGWAWLISRQTMGTTGSCSTHGELAQSYTSRKSSVTFDSRFGKTQVRKAKDIVLQSTGQMDLDDGIGTHPNANGWDGGKGKLPNDYEPDLHFNNIDGRISGGF